MTMGKEKPIIIPELKVGTLLTTYPELEDVLADTAPAFKRLCNPVLRRTVARFTSLRLVARLEGLLVGDLISRLREAAWQKAQWAEDDHEDLLLPVRPKWLKGCNSVKSLDIRGKLESVASPMHKVLGGLKKLKKGHALALHAHSVPNEMVERVTKLGFRAWAERDKDDNHFIVYFGRS